MPFMANVRLLLAKFMLLLTKFMSLLAQFMPLLAIFILFLTKYTFADPSKNFLLATDFQPVYQIFTHFDKIFSSWQNFLSYFGQFLIKQPRFSLVKRRGGGSSYLIGMKVHPFCLWVIVPIALSRIYLFWRLLLEISFLTSWSSVSANFLKERGLIPLLASYSLYFQVPKPDGSSRLILDLFRFVFLLAPLIFPISGI